MELVSPDELTRQKAERVRAEQVGFSQNYALAQNTYLVTESSPIRSVADADRTGLRIGVGARDAGDYFLTRTLKAAATIPASTCPRSGPLM